MALAKTKKHEVVADVTRLLATSKMTVVATYQGTNVKAMQQLRRQARDSTTDLKVVKNRLFKQALAQVDHLKDGSGPELRGMLLYAFNASDEVAPAQAIAAFAKLNPTIEFVSALTADGMWLSADEVKALAALPSKPQLIASTIATLAYPIQGVMSGLAGNISVLLEAVAVTATT